MSADLLTQSCLCRDCNMNTGLTVKAEDWRPAPVSYTCARCTEIRQAEMRANNAEGYHNSYLHGRDS